MLVPASWMALSLANGLFHTSVFPFIASLSLWWLLPGPGAGRQCLKFQIRQLIAIALLWAFDAVTWAHVGKKQEYMNTLYKKKWRIVQCCVVYPIEPWTNLLPIGSVSWLAIFTTSPPYWYYLWQLLGQLSRKVLVYLAHTSKGKF